MKEGDLDNSLPAIAQALEFTPDEVAEVRQANQGLIGEVGRAFNLWKRNTSVYILKASVRYLLPFRTCALAVSLLAHVSRLAWWHLTRTQDSNWCRTSQDGSPAGAARALTFEAPIRPYGSARRGLRAQGVQSIFLEWWCRSEHCRCLLRPYSACACTPTRVITRRAAPCRYTGASGPPALGEGGHSRANIRAAGGVCE